MRASMRDLSFAYRERHERGGARAYSGKRACLGVVTSKKTTAQRRLFHHFSLNMDDSESPVAILGASGTGKTTLLRLIAGLERPDFGEILIEAESAWTLEFASAPAHTPAREGDQKARLSATQWAETGTGRQRDRARPGAITPGASAPRLSMTFQEDRLFPWRTILENVTLPALAPLGAAEARRRGLLFLERVGLCGRKDAYPAELSGGERRRVALARAFTYPSHLILMDEPFQSQDIPRRIALMDILRDLLSIERRFLILVTHDPREALYLARRILVLKSGDDGSCVVAGDEYVGDEYLSDEVVKDNIAMPRYGDPAYAPLEERLLALLGAFNA